MGSVVCEAVLQRLIKYRSKSNDEYRADAGLIEFAGKPNNAMTKRGYQLLLHNTYLTDFYHISSTILFKII